jgi:hypothetical protein
MVFGAFGVSPTTTAKAQGRPQSQASQSPLLVAESNNTLDLTVEEAVLAANQKETAKQNPPATGVQPLAPSPNAIAATSYPFTSSAGAALEDMSTGTTVLVTADKDDFTSAVTPIGFDFWFDGVRQTLFSAGANGVMRLGVAVLSTAFDNGSGFASTTDAPKIAPYFDDLWIGNNGKVHYKIVGTAPNRKLVVEWQNEQIPRVAVATAGAGTFQAWLYETSGKIEFVYGSGMAVNSANAGYSVGLQSGAATNFASVTTSGPTVAYGTAKKNRR